MVSFVSKKIFSSEPPLKEILTVSRNRAGLTIEEAAKKTKISKKYITALEEGDYQELPGEIYAKNFLKVYADFLGLDFLKVLSAYLNERNIYEKVGQLKREELKLIKRTTWREFLATPKIARNFFVGALILILLVYLGFKIKVIMEPPVLEIFSPADNLMVNKELVEVSGKTEKEAILLINGQQVLTDGDGNFSEPLDLQAGANLIKISAQKKHGQETVVVRTVMVGNE